jgi:outer membrane protein OmpA-like peptidoglycan-associated protein
MRRFWLAVAVALLAPGLGYGLWQLSPLDGDGIPPKAPAEAQRPMPLTGRPAAEDPTPTSRPDAAAVSPERSLAAIEVATLAAEGASVIAGRAPANSDVTVIANGRVVARTTASEDGQWSVVVEGLGSGAVSLSVTASGAGGKAVTSPVAVVEVPAGAETISVAPSAAVHRPAAAKEPVRLARGGAAGAPTALAEFAAVVDKARRDTDAGAAASALETRVPIPITFESDTTEMTAEGAKAAALLVDYLRISRPKAITLSGHADSRGTDDYNLDLSRRRLEAIERYLRAAGYAGRLALIPKGRSEPFTGIDRSQASREAVWQADRRVELQLTR